MSDWAPAYYDERYRRLVAPTLTAERTVREVDQLLEWRPSPSRYLDLGCGWGRHVVEAARRGVPSVGVEQSEPFVAAAREEARGLPATFHQRDHADIGDLGRFDLVTCLFNSWGFRTPEADEAALAGWIGAAAPGGVVVIEVWNYPFFAARFEPNGERPVGGDGVVREQRTLEGHRMRIHYEYVFGGERSTASADFRLFSAEELVSSLQAHSTIGDVRTYGDLRGSLYSNESAHLVAVGRVMGA